MVPPPQQQVGAPPPPPPPPLHPHTMYHSQQLNQQQQHQRQHPNGYQQGYPSSQRGGMNRYGPPPMHNMAPQQQHTRVHHYQNHSVVPNSYRHLPAPNGGAGRHPQIGNAGHPHFLPHPAVMVPGASHGMGQLPSQHHHHHQYPPRSFQVPPHQAIQQPHHHHQQYSNNLGGAHVAYSTTVNESVGSTSVAVPKNEFVPSEKSDKSVASELSTAEIQGIIDSVQRDCDEENAPRLQSNMSLSTVSFKDCINPVNNVAASSKYSTVVEDSTKIVRMEHRNATTVMSPITMCFERMLGAGKFLLVTNQK
jgi:hypothetical protein